MRKLSWRQFERGCAVLFEHRGYSVSLTPPSRDGGVDIVVRKDGRKGVAQCKHRRSECVKVSEVRVLLGAKQDFGADQAWMLTSGLVSHDAREFVRRNAGVHIWDADTIAALATRSLIEDVARETLTGEAAPEGDEAPRVPDERVCPECGEKLVERDGRFGPFIGCKGYPKCRYTRDRDEAEKKTRR
jgi:restriction system protein